MLTTGAKIYHETGAYIYLLAAGAVLIDQRLVAGGRSAWRLLAAAAVT
jgi:hypothetical protein